MSIQSPWAYWGRWKTVPLDNSPWLTWRQTEVYREMALPVTLKGSLLVADGYHALWQEDLEAIRPVILAGVEGKSNYFENLFQLSESWLKKLKALEQAGTLADFLPAMCEGIACSMFTHFADLTLESYIAKKLEETGVTFEQFGVLVTAQRPSTLLEEYQKGLHTLTEATFQDFFQEYAWVNVITFFGSALTEARLRQDWEEAKKQIKEEKVFDAKPVELERLTEICAKMTFYRTELMEMISRTAFRRYWKQLEEIGAQHGQSFLEMTYWTHQEILANRPPSDLKERQINFGLINKEEFKVLVGRELEQNLLLVKPVASELTVVKGQIARRGKVQGRAKIMNSVKDVVKVEVGDILIASETTPDYIGAMYKAAAFVTNQGGITSHAAIVARELGKPCIIGTKIATEVFKDGDLVEVDAEKGLVSIIHE